MTIANMIRQLRVVEILMICILAKTLYGKAVNERRDERVKRGYGLYGGNDFDSSVHVSSGVLQYSSGHEHSIGLDSAAYEGHSGSLDLPQHFDSLDSSANNADVFLTSGVSSGYDVWLQPLDESHATSALDTAAIHESSITSINPTSDHVVNSVFSNDSPQSTHIAFPSSQLHTKIGSSSSISSIGNSAADIGSGIHGHGILAVSDNIDFNNVADINANHYTKSYGK